MLTILCIDTHIRVFDTERANRIMKRTREALSQRLAPALDTLIIIPQE